MSTARLRNRVPAATPRGIAVLDCHLLRFHKPGKDGTGKADAHRTDREGDVVWGVLFELSAECLESLDRFEGSQYARVVAHMKTADGAPTDAWAYIAKPGALDESLLPSEAYMRHILKGAREHGLPAEYVAALEHVATRV